MCKSKEHMFGDGSPISVSFFLRFPGNFSNSGTRGNIDLLLCGNLMQVDEMPGRRLWASQQWQQSQGSGAPHIIEHVWDVEELFSTKRH